MAIAELKGTGFTDESILIVSDAKYAQEETLGRAISEEQLASLPDLSSGRVVLIMVDDEERAEDALDILKRHHVVTAGVRIPTP